MSNDNEFMNILKVQNECHNTRIIKNSELHDTEPPPPDSEQLIHG